jgi:hypothetical protein
MSEIEAVVRPSAGREEEEEEEVKEANERERRYAEVCAATTAAGAELFEITRALYRSVAADRAPFIERQWTVAQRLGAAANDRGGPFV